MTWWTYVLAAFSVTATIANIHKRRWCFLAWLFTNCAWCLYNLSRHEYAAAGMFAVYAVLAAWGLAKWRKRG